ncbi:hypothetical protein BY996DRAFT_8466870 [Phakopsora pachyrhizi]|nr:hypothetical protein BY996DRAFT_8466870 [Phakopsora pachyrhizi]
MREPLKKKGREGKVEAFVKGLNSGSFYIVNYDYLPVSRKFTGGKLLDKVENKTMNGGKTDGLLDAALNGKGKGALAENIFKDNNTNLELAGKAIAPELNGGDTQVEELSTNLDAEGKEYEDPDDEISNGLVDPNAGLTLPIDLGSLIGESMKGRGGVNDIVILLPSENQLFIKSISPDLSREESEKHCKKVEGFDYLALSDPHTGKKLHWVGWVTFLPGTEMKETKRTLSESKFEEDIGYGNWGSIWVFPIKGRLEREQPPPIQHAGSKACRL